MSWCRPLLGFFLAVAAAAVAGCGDRGPQGPDPRNNAMRVIQPYFAKGTWVFDDSATGLKAEAFVEGIPEIIDRMVADIPNAKTGFRLTFSDKSFPGHELVVDRGEAKDGGHYYIDPASGRRGWLCPALFKYFREAPAHIYAKADPLPEPRGNLSEIRRDVENVWNAWGRNRSTWSASKALPKPAERLGDVHARCHCAPEG